MGEMAPELLLPLSFALSRTAVARAGEWSQTMLMSLLSFTVASRYLDRFLRGSPNHTLPNVVVVVLSLLVQLVGSVSWWFSADALVCLGSATVPALVRNMTSETIFGICGVAATCVAFMLPRALHIRQYEKAPPAATSGSLTSNHGHRCGDGSNASLHTQLVMPWPWPTVSQALLSPIRRWRATALGATSLSTFTGTSTVADSGGALAAGTNMLTPTPTPRLDGHHLCSGAIPRTRLNSSAHATHALAVGETALESIVTRSAEKIGRREIVAGFRHWGRLRLHQLCGARAPTDASLDTNADGGVRGRRHWEGADVRRVQSRQPSPFLRRGESIFANTEEMTLAAIAAKNKELERIRAQRTALVAVIESVHFGLARATSEQQLAEAEAEPPAALCVAHRALLGACLRAQATLQGVLQEHGEASHVGDEVTLSCCGGHLSGVLPPRSHADPLPPLDQRATRAVGKRRPAGKTDASLTWTGTLGAQEVSARLYVD